MTLIMDGLLLAAAAFAGLYCHVLARRLRALKNLDAGLGGAIVRMTKALEEARRTLEEAKGANRESHKDLKELVTRAEAASGQLRILLAATRDLPEAKTQATLPSRRQQPEAPEPPLRKAAEPLRACRDEPMPSRAAARDPDPRESDPEGVDEAASPRPPLRLRHAPARPVVAAGASEDDILAALADFADSGRL